MRKTIQKYIFAFIFAAQAVFAAPTVSNITFLYGSHSSVTVQFNVSAVSNAFRVRYIPTSQGSCDSGNPSATVENFSFSNLTFTIGIQLPVSGLAANTQYEFCPEASSDGGSTWSTTGGSNPVGADFTTLPLSATHPAVPIHPATFNTSYPDTTQGTCWSTSAPGYCTVVETVSANSCPNLWSDVSAAVAHQKTGGTVIEIPAGSTCEFHIPNGNPAWFQISPDAIPYNPASVSSNTITLANLAGYGLSEGSGVVFDTQEMSSGGAYYPDPPSGVVNGYVYFVHVVDANDFQLYQNWQQETGSETNGSNIVTVSSTAGWASSPGITVGEEIVGSGIPSGTTIIAINAVKNQLTLSASATATASNVTLTFGGPLQTITAGGSGTSHFAPWPRQLPYWVIVRTSTPDSQFAPAGTRVNPSWAAKMVTFESDNAGSLLDPYVYSSHIRFTGIEWTWAPTTEVASDPASHEAIISTSVGMSDIIFDRNWFHGPNGIDDRVHEMMFVNGMNIGIIDSYWDNLQYWHASYTWPGRRGNPTQSSQTPAETGNTSFTVPPTTVYYGAASPANLASTLTVSWTGTPSGSITTPEIAVYFDMNGALQIAAPQGLSVTASAGTVSYTTTSGTANSPGWSACDQGDAMIPNDSQGNEAAAPLGCALLNASGQISNLVAGNIYWGSDTEGCQCFIGGVGPGPYDLSDNYISGSGLIVHFDNSGGYRWRGDYLIRRNYFHIPMKYLNSSGNQWARDAGIPSTGYGYGNRQPLEWKGGEREWIDGNIFDGQFADVNHAAPLDVTAHSGDSYGITDMDVTNNTFEHGPLAGGLAINVMDNDGKNPPFTTLRYRAYNNLAWDINGFIYSDSDYTSFGSGDLGAGGLWPASGGPAEDVILDHNTLYDFANGIYGQLWDGRNGPQEGVSITNNIIPYGIAQDGQDLWFEDNANLNSTDCTNNNSLGTNEIGANCGVIAGVGNHDLVLKDNLIVSTWAAPQYPEGGSQIALSTVKNDWPDYWSQNTILQSGSVMGDFDSIKWREHTFTRSWDANGNYTGTVPDFHLLSQSLYNFGHTTDGLPEGANIDQLEAAQGKVTLSGVNQITSTSANINYVAPDSASCSVDYSSSDPTLINSFTRVQDAGGSRTRNVSLSGLTPHTSYNYRVNCQVQQPIGEFRTN